MHLRRTSFFLAERRDFFIKVNRKNSLVFLKGVSRQQASFLLLYEEEMKDSQFLCFIVERKARLSSSSSSSSEPNLSWSPLSMYLSLSFFLFSFVSVLSSFIKDHLTSAPEIPSLFLWAFPFFAFELFQKREEVRRSLSVQAYPAGHKKTNLSPTWVLALRNRDRHERRIEIDREMKR